MVLIQGHPQEGKTLQNALEQFMEERPRLSKMKRYAQGRHDVLARTRRPGLPNARLPHGFPKYIAQMSAGYMLGEGARYASRVQPTEAKEMARLLRSGCDDALDMDLALQQAVYGRGVSLTWMKDKPRCSALDPANAFVARDDTVERRPMMGVLLTGEEVQVYTDQEVLTYAGTSRRELEAPVARRPHGLSRVPMVEYLNNADSQGDFEDVLPLVDAYDLLASDRLNDRGQFADAMLVLTGVMGLGTSDAPDSPLEAAALLRQERTLSLPDSDSKAEWLVKNPQERDIDVLRKALKDDIHKFSMTPDLDDDRFAGNLSGIAIQYKLFCLDQKTRIKERWFIQGLRERARLLCGWMQARGMPAPDPDELEITLPKLWVSKGESFPFGGAWGETPYQPRKQNSEAPFAPDNASK